jgi:clan AA aspartic protease (TIGR02281 family)
MAIGKLPRGQAFNAFLFVVLCVLFLVSVSTAGDFYRWTDEKGVMHLSDQPPPQSGSATQKPEVIKNLSRPKAVAQPDEGQSREYVVPFQRAHGGMIIEVLFNDLVRARMMVDTGATTLKMNVRLLRKLNLSNYPSKKLTAVTATGIVEAHEIIIEKVDMGGAVRRNVVATFTDESHDFPSFDGLLGLSFLSDFKMTIDYEKNQIHLIR